MAKITTKTTKNARGIMIDLDGICSQRIECYANECALQRVIERVIDIIEDHGPPGELNVSKRVHRGTL